MRNRYRRGLVGLCAVVALVAAALVLTSCEDSTTCPTYAVGAVEGYVKLAGEGVAVEIRARLLEGPDAGLRVVKVESDSTGWYRMELPTGRYWLETGDDYYFHTDSEDLHDVITITPRVLRKDMFRGQAVVRVICPEDLESAHMSLSIIDFNYNGKSQSTTVVNGVAEFEFPMIRPQTYTMKLSLADQRVFIYLPGALSAQDADSLDVAAEAPTFYEVDFSTSMAGISGSVIGSTLESDEVWGPVLSAIAADSTEVSGTYSDEDGAYTCWLFVPEPVKLRVRIGDVTRWVGGGSQAEATVFDLGPGDRISDLTVVGSGIRIQLDGPGDPEDYHSYVTVLDETGTVITDDDHFGSAVSVHNLDPGSYTVHLNGTCQEQVWAPQWYDGGLAQGDAVPIVVAEGELVPLTMTLLEGGRIEGTFTYWLGYPMESVRAALCRDEEDRVCPGYRGWERFADGEIAYSGLLDGVYYLAVEMTGDRSWWYPGSHDFAEALPIVITDHATVTGIDWSLPGPGEGVQP